MMVGDLTELGVDRRIVDLFLSKGIRSLYPPQAEAIPHVLGGKNVVVAAPTASGKSLIAYLALLQGVLSGKKGVYIVPLKALAQEKYEDMAEFSSLGIKVGMSIGDVDMVEEGVENYDILVTTSEKADSILRHRERWGKSVGVIVADEVHLVNDPDRGPTMEVLLARLRHLSPGAQIIALSATISNAMDIAVWLDAVLVKSEWRPTPLREGVFFANRLHFSDGEERPVKYPGGESKVLGMVREIVEEGGQVLVFVSSRKSAEAEARRIALNLGVEVGEGAPGEDVMMGEVDVEEASSLHRRLVWCMSRGVAFHHAGLSSSQRRLVERAFRSGSVKCVVATPTLAAGINMPARRVIIRDVRRYDPDFGSGYIPVLEVKQMCGRAGRPGLDPYGEAIIVARKERDVWGLMERYVLGEPEEIYSKLGVATALRKHILGLFATGTCSTVDELMDFLGGTFYVCQRDVVEIEEEVEKALSFLVETGFLTRDGEFFDVTRFGKLVSNLYVDPKSAVILKQAVERGASVILKVGGGGAKIDFGILHAISATPDMLKLYMSPGEMDRVEERLEPLFSTLILPVPEDGYEYGLFLREVKTALLLYDWIEEKDDDTLAESFGVGPGDVHARVETARWLLHAMEAIASLFAPEMEGPVRRVEKRVAHGIREELLPLVKLPGVGRKRARTLYAYGYRSLSDVLSADPRVIQNLPGFGPGVVKKIFGVDLPTDKKTPPGQGKKIDGGRDRGGNGAHGSQKTIGDFT